ncbi:MAG: hypothetical protein HAW62_06730, partial [Endozoicomonadaceae bacterium]|nr:hypothetical protein [Endozoicomonadaceae bacterium]
REEFKEVLRDILLKVVFYTKGGQSSILQTCVDAQKIHILKEILTWPERLALNSEEKIIIHDLFFFINKTNKTTLDYSISNYHEASINLLQILKDNLDQSKNYVKISKKRTLDEDKDYSKISNKRFKSPESIVLCLDPCFLKQ